MNNYPTLNNDFTRKEESDKIKSNNSYPTLSNQTPKLSSEQQKNINSAYKAKQGGFITDAQYKSNLAKNGVKTWEEKTPEFKPPKTNLNQTGVPKINTTKVKIPNEKLEQERLKNLTGQWDLKKVKSDELDNHIRLKNKRPDDYYREIVDDKEQQKRLDEAFGSKTDFSLFNYENNYDKFNDEEKSMFTHKMQLEFNRQGYRGKDGYRLKTDGILGPNTRKALEDYKNDNSDDYKEAVESRNIRTANYTSPSSRDENRDDILFSSIGNESKIDEDKLQKLTTNKQRTLNIPEKKSSDDELIVATIPEWIKNAISNDLYDNRILQIESMKKTAENMKQKSQYNKDSEKNIMAQVVCNLFDAKCEYKEAELLGNKENMIICAALGKLYKAVIKSGVEYLNSGDKEFRKLVDEAVYYDENYNDAEKSMKLWEKVCERAIELSLYKVNGIASDSINSDRGINMNRVNQDAMILVKRLKSDINASQALLPTMENPWLLGTDQARRYEKNEEGEWEYIPGIVLGIQE